jgi:hypothetical protein
MFISNDYELKKEQYQDYLRQADKDRLISLMVHRERLAVGQSIRDLFEGVFNFIKCLPSMIRFRSADTYVCK